MTISSITAITAIERLEALGRAGITISICCGPCKGEFAWSVTALSPDGQEFARPFLAKDFGHAVEIAEIELQRRGWISNVE